MFLAYFVPIAGIKKKTKRIFKCAAALNDITAEREGKETKEKKVTTTMHGYDIDNNDNNQQLSKGNQTQTALIHASTKDERNQRAKQGKRKKKTTLTAIITE